MKTKLNIKILFLSIMILSVACKKFVEIDAPGTQIVTSTVYTNDQSAISAIVGVYSEMISNGNAYASGGPFSLSVIAGCSSDEFVNVSTSLRPFYEHTLDPTNSTIETSTWGNPYQYIYYCNAILEGLSASEGVTEEVRKNIEGEAKFLRAFNYFFLINLFGEVPLVLTTDYEKNRVLLRSPVPTILDQVVTDLISAKSLLKDDYSVSNYQKTRVNKYAVAALLARVYLYTGNWSEAVDESSEIISNTTLYSLENDLDKIFLANSTEAIWQLMPVVPGTNTFEGSTFKGLSFVAINDGLLETFEPDDARRLKWIDSVNLNGEFIYYPFKYKIGTTGEPLTEYSMVFRLAEQHLMRAEAKANMDDLIGSANDLNIVRTRAGLADVNASSKDELLDAIHHERRIELFSEWGHRWLDLKRTRKADEILSQIKPQWQSSDTLYPIPQSERTNNPQLSQNSGY